MNTIEEVERELGVASKPRGGSVSGCTYNPTLDGDIGSDCSRLPIWHVQIHSSESEHGSVGVFACGEHEHRLFSGPYREAIRGKHEYDAKVCGLAGTWWVAPAGDVGSFCVTMETGLELGYLR